MKKLFLNFTKILLAYKAFGWGVHTYLQNSQPDVIQMKQNEYAEKLKQLNFNHFVIRFKNSNNEKLMQLKNLKYFMNKSNLNFPIILVQIQEDNKPVIQHYYKDKEYNQFIPFNTLKDFNIFYKFNKLIEQNNKFQIIKDHLVSAFNSLDMPIIINTYTDQQENFNKFIKRAIRRMILPTNISIYSLKNKDIQTIKELGLQKQKLYYLNQDIGDLFGRMQQNKEQAGLKAVSFQTDVRKILEKAIVLNKLQNEQNYLQNFRMINQKIFYVKQQYFELYFKDLELKIEKPYLTFSPKFKKHNCHQFNFSIFYKLYQKFKNQLNFIYLENFQGSNFCHIFLPHQFYLYDFRKTVQKNQDVVAIYKLGIPIKNFDQMSNFVQQNIQLNETQLCNHKSQICINKRILKQQILKKEKFVLKTKNTRKYVESKYPIYIIDDNEIELSEDIYFFDGEKIYYYRQDFQQN